MSSELLDLTPNEPPNGQRPPAVSRRLRLGVRGIFGLTAAAACWSWCAATVRLSFLREVAAASLVVVLVALCVARLIQSRFAVIVASSLLMPALLVFTAWLHGHTTPLTNVAALAQLPIIVLIVEVRRFDDDGPDVADVLPCFVISILFALAHPIRPTSSSAMATAMGISLWYAGAIVLADRIIGLH